MHEWRDHDLLKQALDVFGLGSLADSEEAPAELVELAERRRRRPARPATSTQPIGFGPRSTPPAGRSATSRKASGSSAK